MDPTTCYLTILEALRNHDYSRAREYALILKEWLGGGGFYPKGFDAANMHSVLEKALRPACSSNALRFPMLAIVCKTCGAISGNQSLMDAIDAGWTAIDIKPDDKRISHMGICVNCRRDEDLKH